MGTTTKKIIEMNFHKIVGKVAQAAYQSGRTPDEVQLVVVTKAHSLEVVEAVSRVVGREIHYRVVGRRPGDTAEVYADPSRARDELGWTARLDLADMCSHSWRWQSQIRDGYDTNGSGSDAG